MNIEELTIGQARAISALVAGNTGNSDHPFQIGANYHIRTVTHHFTGRLTAVFPTEIVLEYAAWIPDDGRFADAIKTGNFLEVEPFPDGSKVIVGRGSIVNAVELTAAIPRSQK